MSNPSIPMALRFLAEQILLDLRSAPSEFWFGDRKVFLAALGTLDQETCDMLQELHHCGALRFARADLVAAMDPGMVARSEWRHPAGATYHFVEVG